ncbi:MAG TPA: hypothetical protein VGR57_05825 [Ktedonobacterales bacterium]|nr:hypothetical protein [Ktedonobacterales bacterium]
MSERLIEPVPLLDDRARMWLRVPCDDCHGTGLAGDGPAVRCRECGRDYSGLVELTPETWDWKTLPCGHERLALAPLAICLMCAGRTFIEQWVNLGALRLWLVAPALPKIVPVMARKRTAQPRKRPVKVSA